MCEVYYLHLAIWGQPFYLNPEDWPGQNWFEIGCMLSEIREVGKLQYIQKTIAKIHDMVMAMDTISVMRVLSCLGWRVAGSDWMSVLSTFNYSWHIYISGHINLWVLVFYHINMYSFQKNDLYWDILLKVPGLDVCK